MSSRPSRALNPYYKYIYIVVAIFIAIYLISKIVTLFTQSLFFSNNSRINTVFYGSETTFYSIDKHNARHYLMYFPADLRMEVPGGYGSYQVGSLGKLAKLDNNFDILQKTFSVGTTSFVQYYFYEDTDKVFYGDSVPSEKKKPRITDILFQKSNAHFFDRMYLLLTFMKQKADDFHVIAYQERVNKLQDDIFFQGDSFIKESIGLLYQSQYRDEQKSIQIQYPKKYAVAQSIGSLLQGNGIRVSDISLDLQNQKQCAIVESEESTSQTAKDLSVFFNCQLEKGNTDVYDIVFILGNVESEWEVAN